MMEESDYRSIGISISDVRAMLELMDCSLDKMTDADGVFIADMLQDADIKINNELYWLQKKGLI